MEKQVNKIICNSCMGNGYLRINTSSYDEVLQCPKCNSQGESNILQKDIDDVKGVN
jgi:DnaJ-class molecular chaperone